MVRRSIYRSSSRCLRVSTHQWFRGIPIRGGWYTAVTLGMIVALFGLSPHLIWPNPQFLRIACVVVFGFSFFVAIATFKGFASFTYAKPLGLWIIYILWPLICAVIYIVSQLVLVFRTLEDRWPIGDIVFGTAFFTIAQVILFAFSVTICDAIKHYIDGLFFFTLCMLLSVMMVYKYWDSITVRAYLSKNVSRATDAVGGVHRKRTWSSQSVPRLPSGKSKIRSLRVQTIGITQRTRRAVITDLAALSAVSAARSYITMVAVADTHHPARDIDAMVQRTRRSISFTYRMFSKLWTPYRCG